MTLQFRTASVKDIFWLRTAYEASRPSSDFDDLPSHITKGVALRLGPKAAVLNDVKKRS